MNRLLAASFILLFGLISCKKTTQAPPDPPYFGQWLWIGTSSGFFTTDPSKDTAVVLSLGQANLYKITLDGQLSLEGIFATDSSDHWRTLQFSNISQPAGDTTSRTSGNITYLYFNFAKVGRMTIFQNNVIIVSGDTLTMLRNPITPETPVSTFVRVTGGKL
jgi:hypothetical protein